MAPSPSKDYVGYIQQQLAKFEMKNHLQSALKRSNLWEQLVRNQSHNLQSSDNENPMETTSEVAALFKWAQCGPPRLLPQKSRRKVATLLARLLTNHLLGDIHTCTVLTVNIYHQNMNQG